MRILLVEDERELSNAYDTYQKVVSGNDQLDAIEKPVQIEINGNLLKR